MLGRLTPALAVPGLMACCCSLLPTAIYVVFSSALLKERTLAHTRTYVSNFTTLAVYLSCLLTGLKEDLPPA